MKDMRDQDIFIRQLQLGPMANFVYVIACPETREAAVVDPGWDVEAILKVIEENELKLTRILLSHTHMDHMNAVQPLLERVPARLYVHKSEADRLRFYASDLVPVETEEEMALGTLQIKFLHTPGHTPGSLTFQVRNSLITGDTLFVGSCGRFDLPGGDPEQMWRSLTRLARLDKDLLVLPGHDYGDRPVSTIAHECLTNPYLQFPTLDRFLRAVGYR